MNGSFDWQSALGWAPLQVRESWSDSTCNLKKEIGTVYLLLWLVTTSEVKDTHSGQHFVNIFTSPQSLYQNAQRTGNLSPSKTRCHTQHNTQFILSNDASKSINKCHTHCNTVLLGACCCLSAHSNDPFTPSTNKYRLCYTECRGMTNLHPKGEW